VLSFLRRHARMLGAVLLGVLLLLLVLYLASRREAWGPLYPPRHGGWMLI
jgi:hypothetical protein